MMKKIALTFWFVGVWAYGVDIDTLIPLHTNSDHTIQYYQASNGQTVGINNTLILKCNSSKLCIDADNYTHIQNIKPITAGLYKITLDDKNSTLSLCKSLELVPDVVRATPNFIIPNAYR